MAEQAGVPVLRARGVRVERPGARSRVLRRRGAPRRVVDGLDVEVRSGDLVWIVGAPGEGAQEAGRVLAGVLAPTSGVVELNGRELAGSRGRRRTRSQRQRAWLDAGADPRMDARRTALEVVAEAAAGSARSVTAEHLDHARALLGRLGLDVESAERRMASISAADARRVDAARALAPNPRAVVYQRPAAFDPDGDPIWVELTRLRATESTALVVISGILPGQLDPGSRVLVICGGRVVEVLGNGDLAHPLHPYTRTLAGAVPAASGGPGGPGGPNRAGGASRSGGPGGANPPGGARRSDPRAGDADDACPFRGDCPRAKARCATERPRLARPLGATHEVACHFPEDPRRRLSGPADGESGPARQAGSAGVGRVGSDEPTAREFADG